MLITVIIVNFNSSTDLLEAVDSLEKSQIPEGFSRKVVIIENGSKDQEKEWQTLQVLKKYDDVTLLRSEKNLGFTGANNLAIKKRSWGG